MRLLFSVVGVLVMMFTLAACSPDIGSEEWCADLKGKSRGEWTVNEVSDYAKYRLFK